MTTKTVSVPCRGLFYFIDEETGMMIESPRCFRPLPGSFLFHLCVCVWFPSPAGVFFISSINAKTWNKTANEFPSPAGVFFISSIMTTPKTTNKTKVSVPCRGLFYFIEEENYKRKKNNSFRPLPGSFLFHQAQFLNTITGYGFPSPAGVFFISSLSLISRYI